MSYLLIGNISALICEETIEPLANARIRIYLPESQYDPEALARGIFKDLRQLSGTDVQAKEERLLAESYLDERGNFSLGWEDLHLFTEPLEMDICINTVPGGDNGQQDWIQYHLSTFVPHWKRSREKYLAAFAYVVPADKWSAIRRAFGAWVIAGTVRHHQSHETMGSVRVEAYNAHNGKLLGKSIANELGRYQIHFSRKAIHSSRLLMVGGEDTSYFSEGPDVYFKVYNQQELIWSENSEQALQPDRQQIPHCRKLNLMVKPGPVEKKPVKLPGWFNDFISNNRTKNNYKDRYVTY